MFIETYDKLKTLSESKKQAVEDRYTQCLWYAWGQIDAGVGKDIPLTLDDGWAFAREQAASAADYHSEVTYCMDSILGGWANYIARVTTERKAT